MTKTALNEEQKVLLDILENQAAGLKISEIADQLDAPISRRTLLRRLTELKEKKYLITKGERSGLRYIASNPQDLIALSTKAKKLKQSIEQPLQKRKPVAYQKDFLYHYKPNQTLYLPASLKKYLHQLGNSSPLSIEASTFTKKILDRLLIDLSWNSSRLEGNTYSLLDTERLIEHGALAEGKNAFDAQMIINHKDAIEFMVNCIDETFESQTLLNLHALLSNNLITNPRARGQLRQIPVSIAKSVYHPPEIPQLINEHFNHLVKMTKKIKDPFEQAFFLMVQLPYLHPFEDVNKRVSRLALNIPLLKNSLPPLSFIDVPNRDYISGLLAVYEKNDVALIRELFAWAYERSAQQYQVMQDTLGEPNKIQMQLREELKTLINLIINSNIHNAKIIEKIDEWTKKHITKKHQNQFSHIVEKELAGLHEGNLAIYKINPNIFKQWRHNKK